MKQVIAVPSRCFVVLTVSALGILGCKSKPDRPEGPMETARYIREMREKAADAYDRFQQAGTPSDPNGDWRALSEEERDNRARRAGLAALEEYASYEEETTKVARPDSCPVCYLRYALALRRLGNFHRVDFLLGPPSEKEEHRRAFREYYTRSNRFFLIYFNHSPQGSDQFEHYASVADNYANLEDYRSALQYLDLTEQAAAARISETGRANLAKVRREWQRKIIQQDEDLLEEELRRERSSGQPGN